MRFSAAQIAMLIDGDVEGDAETSVGSFEKIEEAQQGQLAFLGNPKYEEYLYTTGASIVIVDQAQQLKHPVEACLIRVPNAYSAFATLLTKYQEMTLLQMTGIEDPSFIHATATLGENIFVGAFAYIGENVQIGNKTKIFPHVFLGRNVKVGENTVIHPGVIIYNDCVIRNNVTIHAGTVIGSDGFGFAPQSDTSYKKVPQIGNVIVEDNVEIGANTTIDRATIGSTIIRRGVKLDNLIQVAHNVEIGSNTVVAAQVGISGSTKVGENVMIGGQAGLAGHIQIANGCKINGQSGVSKSIKTPNVAITGTNAYDYASAMKSQAISRNLPEMEKRLRRLELLLEKAVQ